MPLGHISFNSMPINIIEQEIFNHSNTRFNSNLFRWFGCSNITFVNHSWSFSMFLHPNRERWLFNISSGNNSINIVNDSFFFSFYWFFNFLFHRWVIFEPLLLRDINMSSKWFTKGGYNLRVKSIFSAKLLKSIGIHKRFNTIILMLNTWLFTFVEFPIFRVAFNSFQ